MKKLLPLLLIFPAMSHAAVIGAGSFTPTSVKLPIYEIGFADANNTTNVTAWRCAAQTDAGCTLDIADSDALKTAFSTGSQSVAAGTYAAMYARTCQTTTSYTMQVKGTVTISGTSYTTQTGSEPLTNSGTADYASISITGCQQNIYFPGGITITSGQSLTVNLLTSLSNLVLGYYNTAGSTNFPANCIKGTQSALCVAYPSLIPYVGSSTPSIEVYLLTSSSSDTTGANAFGQFTRFVDADGNTIGISTGAAAGASTVLAGDTNVYQNTPCPASGCNWKITPFASPVYATTKSADGTLVLQGYGDYGSTDAATAAFLVPAFPLPAVGAVSSTFVMSNPNGKIFSSAVSIYTTRIR